jgi:hypothetical protein
MARDFRVSLLSGCQLEGEAYGLARRLLEPLGYMPPAKYEARHYEQAAVA